LFLGLDGFNRGWVVAGIDRIGNQYFDYSPSLSRLLSVKYHRAMIDIPIGLPDTGYRDCDLEARTRVGNSVFLGARRSLLSFETFEQANRYYWATEGRGSGISQQLWHIREKIREVDDLVAKRSDANIFETHPEVIFAGLFGGKLDRKTTAEGRSQRISVLERNGFSLISRWLKWRYGTGIKADDLIDACACAIAARDSQDFIGSTGEDARGLQMRIAV
jgi:predicted RNase H-like nuclease